MIWESGPWKRDLARRAQSLQRRARQVRWTKHSLRKVEQDVFLAAYSIRKLVDSHKISDEIESTTVQVEAYPKRKEPVDILNWHKIDELYELEAKADVTLSLREICNQIIHSFVFLLSFVESGALTGFFLASDRTKDHGLYFLPLAGVVSLCTRVAEDDIVSFETRRTGDGEPMRVTRKSRCLPVTEGPDS